MDFKSHPVSGARTGIQPQFQQGTGRGSSLGRRIHLEPPVSDLPRFSLERAPTSVISHVDQEVRDPRCFELFDRSLDIKRELGKISFERANKHLEAKRIRPGGNTETLK
jgi:hypothetical protein